MQSLAASRLATYAQAPVWPHNVTLGHVVDSGQRALFLFYDEWGGNTYYEATDMHGNQVGVHATVGYQSYTGGNSRTTGGNNGTKGVPISQRG